MILSLREYFLFAMNNECYNRKEWCFTAFTQSNPVPLGKNPEPYVGQLVTLHDGEIGYISEIVSSTSIIVGSPFSQIANLQEMIILSDVEPLLLFTEDSLPITTESNELITL